MIDSVGFSRIALGQVGMDDGNAIGSSSGDRHLAESFQALMERPKMADPVAEPVDAGQAAAHLLREQNAQFVNVNRSMMETLAATPALDMRELHARSMQMQVDLATMNLDVTVKLGVVGASKSAIETLMKNQ
ncbi:MULTISPECIES: EscI/YscI/HrpB family type III secretion system inner rod protein [Burkholderia]|uniref:Type III secretion inner rod protein HrpB2 n=1 Tax=Burkholderia pyrrocinia TaxID=60550 RepID=A0A318HTV4_BURPY|nr:MULTISPECIES: EscI/YscI/HrpB family type III secretion system inner rod protein [Burkholderia]PXX21935.1 type III secretion inner rod protein HrpB2 [Burkholderia pyrrocinia]SFW89896.1 type III secretion inner rod protein HrpB2 [Burkholderia sp. NFACC33-1]SFY46356.1 type III secretion inner rod protein HrpB2 [Burkholderia sp. NFPP32]